MIISSIITFIVIIIVSVCKMTPGWIAPKGVENVHTLCAGKPESNDRCNNIYVKRLEISSVYYALYKSGILFYYYYHQHNNYHHHHYHF